METVKLVSAPSRPEGVPVEPISTWVSLLVQVPLEHGMDTWKRTDPPVSRAPEPFSVVTVPSGPKRKVVIPVAAAAIRPRSAE